MSKTIIPPFTYDMAVLVTGEKKICTSRNKKYGNPGDRFEIVSESYSVRPQQ